MRLYRACEYERVNRQDYCTISIRGMTRFRSDDDTEYIALNDWEQELTYFKALTKVKLLFTALESIVVSPEKPQEKCSPVRLTCSNWTSARRRPHGDDYSCRICASVVRTEQL